MSARFCLRLRARLVPCITLSALLACSSEDDDAANPDAAVLVDASLDSAATLPDASSPDAGADAASSCSGGKLACDGTCIDPIAATGEALTQRVFTTSCGFASSCHGGTSPKEGLALDTVDHLFETAVGKSSLQKTNLKLISAGNPEQSYLLDKLLGRNLAAQSSTMSATTIMPQPPSEPLCAAKIEAVRAWIQAGAPR